MRRRDALLVALLTPLVVAGCGSSDGSSSGRLVAVDGVEVVDAWVRPTPPGTDSAAVYVTIRLADDAAPTALLEATSDRCAVLVPHVTTFDDNGIATMDAALDEQLTLTSEHPITMEPTGLHLMCLGLVDPFADGERFDVAVRLADHAAIDVPVSVERR